MNNFDENNEFVKRPSNNTQAGKQTPSTRIPMGEVRRPNNVSSQSNRGQIRRPVQSNTNAKKQVPQAYTQKAHTPPRKKESLKIKSSDILRNILIFIAMLAGLLFIGFSLLLSSLYVAPEKIKTNYTYVYDGKTELPSVTVNKVLYMNITELSDMCDFIVSGSKDCLRYTVDNGEYAEFTVGSVSAKINADIVNMEGAALVRENENVWIPLSFAEAYISGLDIQRDEEHNTISIKRQELTGSTEENPRYSKITFRIKGSQTLEGIDENTDIGSLATPDFINDLSEYEQYMNPQNRDGYLILVNKTSHIDENYLPENLVSITNVRKDGRKEQMVECAEKALQALFIEMKSAGYTDVSVTSGYRSYNKQSSLFNTYLQRERANNPSLTLEEAKEIVLTYSAFPGTSEHQTGLCVDMHNLPSADVSFANKAAYTWLKENCYKFGFVIRFPEDKVDITGYSFEPWHYRFVGRYHATRMYNLGMCLEEYVDYISRAEEN